MIQPRERRKSIISSESLVHNDVNRRKCEGKKKQNDYYQQNSYVPIFFFLCVILLCIGIFQQLQFTSNDKHVNIAMKFFDRKLSKKSKSCGRSRDEQEVVTSDIIRGRNIKPFLYSNPKIGERGRCKISVVITDPDLECSVFNALESVAANVHPIHLTCIIIQTSLCRIEKAYNIIGNVTLAYEILVDEIYDMSMPLLRSLIQLGNVRVTIVDHNKYQLNSCDDFRSVNGLFFNIDYWSDYQTITQTMLEYGASSFNDAFIDLTYSNNYDKVELKGEFIAGTDSDQVLIIQNDAVLCHGFDVDKWDMFAYVGAPWNKNHFQYCNRMTVSWKDWHTKSYGDNQPNPAYPIDMCHNEKNSPVGNGGLSLRSRYWMRKVINYCPQAEFSGLSQEQMKQATCLASDNTFFEQEDYYFSTILRGLFHNHYNVSTGHKMPSGLEAALFATETIYFTDVLNQYPDSTPSLEQNLVERLWWKGIGTNEHAGWNRYQNMKSLSILSNGRMPVIPIGLHAVYKYDTRILNKDTYRYMLNECPYLAGVMKVESYFTKIGRLSMIKILGSRSFIFVFDIFWK